MKRIIRWLLSPLSRASRPVMDQFDARVIRLVAGTIEARMVPPIVDALAASEARLERIEGLVSRADRSASMMAEEVDLVLNGLSREIFRLQARVEAIRMDARDENRPALGGLSILPESEADVRDRPEPAPVDRSRVG